MWAVLGGLLPRGGISNQSALPLLLHQRSRAKPHPPPAQHLLKVAPVLAYLLLGAPAGSDVLVVAHLAFDCAGIYSTFSLVNWIHFAVGSLLALGLDAAF